MKTVSLSLIFILLLSMFLFPTILGANDTTTDTNTSTTDDTNETTESNDTDETTDNRTRIRNATIGIQRAIDSTTTRSERAITVLRLLRECEQIDNRTQRIECRLQIPDREEHENKTTRIHEVCKKLNDREECQTLHRAANHCYSIENGRQKAKCFMRVSGFIHANINDEDDRVKKTRRYLIYLFAELQERIENRVAEGTLDSETGTSLIEQIVGIEEDILNKEARSVIRPKLQTFRTAFREAMQ